MSKKFSKNLHGGSNARVKVIGVGGGGGNAVSRMSRDFLKGVEFIAVNTDVQDLDCCLVKTKLYIGRNLTKGLGTGMNPELGRQAAEENRSELVECLQGADLVFVTAGMGGGTGTGAAPVIAEAAKQSGALTVAVVTKPFSFEGSQRSRIAQEGLLKLKDKVDALIVIPNDRIFSIINQDTSILKAFESIDNVLRNAVSGIVELIATPGIVNLDFADVRVIMEDAGAAIVGVGSAIGKERAVSAVTQAVNSPLLEVTIDGAKGVLLGIAGGKDLKMSEINDVARSVAEAVDPGARIIFGAYHDKKLKNGAIKITLIATGFNGTKPANSLFGQVAEKSTPTAVFLNADFNKNEPKPQELAKFQEKEVKIAEEKDEEKDIWDIPSFMRKKRR
ncbi:MAG: cell division protein FtsZ [Candidatus Liptonbacteria bacterium]|nr:cell division protein FtsZ [Candidatus Liptonbacteria bacterium]